jgi:hypothetical protein
MIARSFRLSCDELPLVVRALKISQLTDGGMLPT